MLEVSCDKRGNWRVRVLKPDGAVRYEEVEYTVWMSAPYMQRDVALADVKNLIDSGGLR